MALRILERSYLLLLPSVCPEGELVVHICASPRILLSLRPVSSHFCSILFDTSLKCSSVFPGSQAFGPSVCTYFSSSNKSTLSLYLKECVFSLKIYLGLISFSSFTYLSLSFLPFPILLPLPCLHNPLLPAASSVGLALSGGWVGIPHSPA